MKKKETGGTCYQDAFRAVMDMPSQMEDDAKLVHGTVYSTHLERRILHAWVEIGGGDVVMDSTINFVGRAEKYYDSAKAQADAKYSKTEMSVLALRTGHFGPWEGE